MSKLVTLILASSLALASCATDPTTSATTQEVTASTVTVKLWNPEDTTNTSVDAFWDRGTGGTPVPVPSMQVLVQHGDAGGTLTRGFPTAYVWLISDGNHVYKVWRVAMDQYTDFTNFMSLRHKGVMVAHPGYSAGGAGTPDGGDLGIGPHIGPHGDGDTYFTQDLVNQALTSANTIHGAWNDFSAQAGKEVRP